MVARDGVARLLDFGLAKLSGGSMNTRAGTATIYIGLGDHTSAFECLDRAIDERESWMVTLKTNPFFDCVRSDPRFTALLNRVGLEK